MEVNFKMSNKMISLSLIGILMAISNITLALDKPQKIEADDKFLIPSEKQIQGEKEGIKSSPPLKSQIPQNLPNPEIEFVSGIKYANNGEYNKAIEIFNGMITEYPNTKIANDAQYMLSKIQQEQSKPEPVSQPMQPAKLEIPEESYPDYQFNLGLKYYREKNFKEALVCFQNVVNTAPEGSKLSNEAKDAVEKVQKRLKPQVSEPQQEQPTFKITKTKEEIQKEWYEKIVQWQQERFDEAMKLKEEGKLQEALEVLEKLMNSRSSPILDKAAKEMVKIQGDLGLLEQVEETPKNIEPGFRKLSDDELPEFEKKIRSGELKIEQREKVK